MTGTLGHVLFCGQSLSLGFAGAPALSTSQPYANRMFGEDLEQLVPLVERGVESPASGFANLVTELTGTALLVSAHGVNGTPYAGLKKGTLAYATGMAHVRAARALGHEVRALVNVHGESDHTGGSTSYEADLRVWQADYEADIAGDRATIPMLVSQVSSFTRWGAATSVIPAAQLAAHRSSRGKIVLVGPKYHLPYVDGVHLTNEGYRRMGEEYAKVYARVVHERGGWEPLGPREITRDGKTLRVRFHVPSPPLVLDTALVTDPGGFGFEYVEDGAVCPIDAVEVVAPDEVAITLARAPQGRGRLRYAYSGTPGAGGGPTSGPRGNLRDSDGPRSRSGAALVNWCVHFDEQAP